MFCCLRFLACLPFLNLTLSASEFPDFRPAVTGALKRGEKRIVIPPGNYRLAPEAGDKVVWTIEEAKDTEIVAEGVTLTSTKLTRAIAIHGCSRVTLRGLAVDYDPLPFTQGVVIAAAPDKSWIDVRIHAGYPLKPYSRIDVVDRSTRYRKKGMPFLWGTKAEMKGEDIVRVTREKIGEAALPGDLASLNTGPAGDGIPHAISLENCDSVILKEVTVHSAPGMGILEADGEGKTQYLGCKVVPGPKPRGATEERLLSSSWDAMQVKTVRVGPKVQGCEITEAGDDSWSVQSSDFLVLKRSGKTVTLASRDEFTRGVMKGDRIQASLGSPVGRIISRRDLSRDEAGLSAEVLEKLKAAESWSEWKVSPRCIEVEVDAELELRAGDSVFSPDRMGNGFEFAGNWIHSPGRILIKAAGTVQGNMLDHPHALTVCPELPGNAAAGIDGLVIRKNVIGHAGWFCAAPWSASAGALSITAGAKPPEMRAAGIFRNVVIEDNMFAECEGPNLVLSSAEGVVIRNNRFVRPMREKGNGTGASYGIPQEALIWISESKGVALGKSAIVQRGNFAKEEVAVGKNVEGLERN
jgi:hypothetical protein